MRARARSDVADRRHVALVGFMGAGKSTVGRMIAERLGASFVDLDEVITRKAGRTIPEIFREHGEVGFRAHERAALREVLESGSPLVLATGGGTFVDASMRGWVQAAARTVYLKASPDVLFARVGGGGSRSTRPLLSGPDPLATVRRLLAERAFAYEQCEIVVTTDGASPAEVAEEVFHALRERPRPPARRPAPDGDAVPERAEPVSAERTPERTRSTRFLGERSARERTPTDRRADPRGDARRPRAPPVRTAPVPQRQAAAAHDDEDPPERGAIVSGDSALVRVHAPSGSYAVELRATAGAWLADAVCAVCPGDKLALISDTTVAALHARPLAAELAARGKRVRLHAFAPGEESKTLATAGELLDALLDDGLSRADSVVALGGGVVGDVAGFVASTLLRGVGLVQVPTTTLAAVDSSVGGKTAVNTPRGKNLVGTFYQPRAVLVAGAHLATQPLRQHAAGLVEALKMAAALDAHTFDELADDLPALLAFEPGALARAIARAVSLKAAVVARDERETGERAVLNFGHTIGHAIETGEQYRLLHGEAVALGMLAEAAFAEQEGLAEGVGARLTAALGALGVPTRWQDASIDLAAMALDKKREGGGVRLPVVTRIGSYELQTVPLERLVRFVEQRSG